MTTERIDMSRGLLLDALGDGAVVATGNARLSRSLAVDFERRMLAQGLTAWATPAVLPLGAWLLERYQEVAMAADLPRLLAPEQEQQVWAEAIRQDGDPLLRVEATARRAAAAWKLMREWRLDLSDRRFAGNDNSEAFKRWALVFQAWCRQREQASESDATALLIPWLGSGACTLPRRLLLAGLQELIPEQQRLVGALREAGCAVDWVGLSGKRGRARRVQAADAASELEAAAQWARWALEERPEARIGLVVPDLAERRGALEQVLAQTLDPASLLPGERMRPRPWNISLGRPLSAYPVVRVALGLLALMRYPVDTARFGELLLSPHWALPADPVAQRAALDRRGLLDARIRRRGDAGARLATLAWLAGETDQAGEPQAWQCPGLARRLDAMLKRSHDLPARATAGGWAGEFTAWLKAAGWGGYAAAGDDAVGDAGGGRPLDSHEYQAVEAWHQLLSRFGALEDFAGSLSRGEAMVLLGRMAAEAVFQPRSGDAPVQVLGLYEANGLAFDGLWVTGMHDAAWPPPAGPDPFIPLALQRERGLPHCDPERERAWAEEVTAALVTAAPEVVFSWPGRDGHQEFAPSPLLAAYESPAPDRLPAANTSWAEQIRESVVAESPNPPEPIGLQDTEVSGGSRLFEHQAACPFRAFAEHRLGARPLDRVQQGLDPKRRGSLLHDVLQTLWEELQSQAGLLALSEAQLQERVRAHVAAALERQQGRSPVTLSARYAAVEAGRLEEKVLAWLEIERGRAPFRLVASEQAREVEIGGLQLRVKLDRVDELEDGARVVLDYKTGKVQPGGWFGERPDEPQLPLYGVVSAAEAAAAGAPGIAAIAYAQIRPDGAGFKGVVRGEGVLPGLPGKRKGPLLEATQDWPAVVDQWSGVLEALAGQFRAGVAAVDPKKGLKTCRDGYCELSALCRINERLAGMGEDGDEGGENGDAESGGHAQDG